MLRGRSHLPLILILLPCLASCEGWRLERAGRAKCEKGLALIQRVVNDVGPSGLSRPEKVAILCEGAALIRDGMASTTAAQVKTGKSCDVTRYLEAYKVSRMKIAELEN